MIIEILVNIVSFFVILSIEHFLLPIGFFSIWVLLVLYLYQKLHKTIWWVSLIIAGLALSVSFNLGLGTYLLSAGLALCFLFVITKFIPDDHFLTKYIPYLLSFLLFYFAREIFGSLSVLNVFPVINWTDFRNFAICSLVSTFFVVLLDQFYSQIRSNDASVRKGMGIEIRRK